jgi:chromosome segregation ATPase
MEWSNVMSGLKRAVVVIAGVGAAIFSTACSSGGGGRTAESQSAIVSLRDTRAELAKGKAEVSDATAALDKLTAGGGNLEQSYKQYAVAVKDVQLAGDRARARAQAMQENGRKYMQNWEKESEQMSSPELRAGATERRQRVKDNYDQIASTGRSVRDAYQPFLRDLQDIQRALANDLTPAGVDSAKSTIAKAKGEGAEVNERLDALIAQLDSVSGGMSSKGASAGQPMKASQSGK